MSGKCEGLLNSGVKIKIWPKSARRSKPL